jgi:chromosome segregation ATPase
VPPTDEDLEQTDRLPVLEPVASADPAARSSAATPDGEDALRRSPDLAHAEAGELGATASSLRRALAFAHTEIAELSERLSQREREFADLNERSSVAERESAELNERSRVAERELAELNERLGLREREIAVLEGAVRVAADERAAAPPPRPAAVPVEADLAAQLRDAQARCTRYLEALQSREWQRGVFEERVRALEDELEPLRRAAQEFEPELARLTASVEALTGRLAAQVAVAQAAAPPPDAADGAYESGAWRANAAAREAELEVERAARFAAERATRISEAAREQQVARITELEAFVVSVNRALQAQTETVNGANERVAGHERVAAELRARISQLEESVLAAQHSADRRARTPSRDDLGSTASGAQIADLAARLEHAEREGHAAAAAAAAEVESLHSRHHQLVLQLERTRGALEERDLQIRRLERNLSRRYAGGPGDSDRSADPIVEGPPATGCAALVPLDGSAPRLLERGRRTRIGRAPDNDICIEDSSVSRHHAIVVSGPNGTFIEDLDSVNGVGVNGRRIRHERLNEGDFVTLGTMRFRFKAEARSAAQG